METYRMKILPGVVGCLAALSLVTASITVASSQEANEPVAYSSTTSKVGSRGNTATSSTAGPFDRKPGPAWKTIGGTIKHIKGEIYTVEDYEGNHVRLYISRETKRLRGTKKVGDPVRAEITRGGFANSIQ